MSHGTESCHYHLHRNILCAASNYFRERLVPGGVVRRSRNRTYNGYLYVFYTTFVHLFVQVDDSVRAMSLDMKTKTFEAFLQLVYEGFTVIDPNDLDEFQAALNLFDLTCRPPADGPPPEMTTAKRVKTEASEDTKPRPIMALSLNDLSEDKVKRLIREGPGLKEFICCICGKQYTARHNVFNHIMDVHRDVRDYPCLYCPANFATSSLLAKHTSKCHAAMEAVRKAHED